MEPKKYEPYLWGAPGQSLNATHSMPVPRVLVVRVVPETYSGQRPSSDQCGGSERSLRTP